MRTYTIYFRMVGYVFTIIMHVANVAIMHSSFPKDIKDPEIKHFKGFQMFFFTCWNFSFQTLFAAFSLYCDIQILRNVRLPKFYKNFRREVFNIVVWPATSLVFVVFWAFWIYDRELIYPAKLDTMISNLSNQIMHGYILPVVLWEMMFNYRPTPKNHTMRIISALFVEVLYIITVFSVKNHYGVWIYPVLGKLDGTLFLSLFFIVVALFLIGLYHLQWSIYSVLWGRRSKESIKSS